METKSQEKSQAGNPIKLQSIPVDSNLREVSTNQPSTGKMNLNTMKNLNNNKENFIQNSRVLKQAQIDHYRNTFINLELNSLKTYCYFYGIYCVPRHMTPHIWDCIIFIRSGLYKNAKFKFRVEFPRGYPKLCPNIFFKSKVYHPLVNYETGKVDTSYLNPSWKADSTVSHNLFSWLKTIFHDIQYLQITTSYNPEAATNFIENIDLFYEKVCESVENADKVLYEHEENEGLKFSEYTTVHEGIQKKLSDIVANKEIPDSSKVKKFIDSLLEEVKTLKKNSTSQ